MAGEVTNDIRLEKGPLWITRDRRNGVLEDECDVWRTPPDRIANELSVLWFVSDLEAYHVGRMSIADVERYCDTKPDDDLQTIKVGR